MRVLRHMHLAVFTLAACAPAPQASGPLPVTGQKAQPVRATPAKAAAVAGGHQASDRFIWAVGHRPASSDAPHEAALEHLGNYLGAFGAAPRDLNLAKVRALHDLDQGGYVAWVHQTSGGVEIYPTEARVLMRPDLSLVAISGRLEPVAAKVPRFEAAVQMEEAVALAIGDVVGLPIEPVDIFSVEKTQGNFRYFDIDANSSVALPEARVKPFFWFDGRNVEPAWFVEMYVGMRAMTDSEAFRFILSARDGRVLDRRDLTHNETYRYRVWASSTGDLRPFDGPITDFSPHPTGNPDGSQPSLIPAANLVSVEAFNTNPSGGVDPWLPNRATQTIGNNVDAYTDDNAPDGYSNDDIRATTTSANTFDRPFDLTQGPVASEAQSMASVTSLFFVNNWLHDYWYDAGFNEAAGNAQQSNFGRGGVGGDRLRAEAQDGHASGQRNNANMSTPSDGMSPRMQMYTWTGSANQSLTVTATSVTTPIATNLAFFGPNSFNVTGPLVLADDGAGVATDGCSPLTNNVSGAIVLIDRGACAFTTKVLNAQNGGALGVVIANNRAGNPPGMGGTNPAITIGSLSVLQSTGNELKAALQRGSFNATLQRTTAVDRDGSLDHGVVAHEWGHYLHNRLADCGSLQCRGMGEGWADFLTLHTFLTAGDNLDGSFAVGVWATRGRPNSAYFGIRRAPYSVNRAINSMSFRHIQNGEPLPTHPLDPGGANSQVHNTGEVWNSMLFDSYVALLRPTETSTGPSFDSVRQRFASYLVGGLMMTPRDATFTEQRDAILAAISVRSPTDLDIVARAFAGRGSGSCAVSPPRNSSTHVGVVEATILQPQVTVGAIQLDDSGRSCDGDGVLDGEELGLVTLEIGNAGPVSASNTMVSVTSTIPGVSFPNGSQISVASIGPYGMQQVTLPIEIAANVTGITPLTVVVESQNAASCETTITSTVVSRMNIDEVAGVSIDDVEATSTAWSIAGQSGTDVWARTPTGPLQHVWRGVDFGSLSDTSLVTPVFQVGTSTFSLTMMHRYRFEADAPDGSATNWDGAVVEVSTDGGTSWEDISTYDDPGYRGALTDTSGNPLATRQALVGTSTAWPAYQSLTLSLGTAFANQSVQIRFRIGTDAAVGDFGIELDDIEVRGATNAPFIGLVPDGSVCPIPLIARAGADQMVQAERVVFLDGTGSVSSENLPLTYSWTQVAGPAVSLERADTAEPLWVAPALAATATLRFELSVGDGTRTATDAVDVTVVSLNGPMANAGPDQMVAPGAAVILDGSASTFDARLQTTFAWRQTAGPQVTLQVADGAITGFEAPVMETASALSFELSVSDGTRTSTDGVDIMVAGTPELLPLTAVAGDDQNVEDTDVVVLDGSMSSGDPRFPVTLSWAQTDGPAVTFIQNNGANAVFEAKGEISAEVMLTFELTATDGRRTETDSVMVTVAALPAPPPPPPPMMEEEGCACTAHQSHRSTPWLGALLVGLGLVFRRRRK